MAYSEKVQLAIVGFANHLVSSVTGAYLFIYDLIHVVPLTNFAVELAAVFGMYYGIHVYTNNRATQAAFTATNAITSSGSA